MSTLKNVIDVYENAFDSFCVDMKNKIEYAKVARGTKQKNMLEYLSSVAKKHPNGYVFTLSLENAKNCIDLCVEFVNDNTEVDNKESINQPIEPR
jgi:hypothetical protein